MGCQLDSSIMATRNKNDHTNLSEPGGVGGGWVVRAVRLRKCVYPYTRMHASNWWQNHLGVRLSASPPPERQRRAGRRPEIAATSGKGWWVCVGGGGEEGWGEGRRGVVVVVRTVCTWKISVDEP